MSNLGRKVDRFVARFRFLGKKYQKSLKTINSANARTAISSFEQAIDFAKVGIASSRCFTDFPQAKSGSLLELTPAIFS